VTSYKQGVSSVLLSSTRAPLEGLLCGTLLFTQGGNGGGIRSRGGKKIYAQLFGRPDDRRERVAQSLTSCRRVKLLNGSSRVRELLTSVLTWSNKRGYHSPHPGAPSSPHIFMSAESEAGREHLTELLVRWSQGDKGALQCLIPIVYQDLRKLAHHHLR